MTERIDSLRGKLATARDYLNAVLDQVGDRWDTEVYSDGLQWSVGQLLNHLADADRGHNYQVMSIAAGKEAIPEDFDIERYNKGVTNKTAEQTPEQAREMLAANRVALDRWLADLEDAALDIEGRHASLRILSVAQILQVIADHERGHAEDIARRLNIDVS
jgi:uncharacterized damage-inducible protein DinB